MKIKNVVLIHHEPMSQESIRRIGGTEVIVEITNNSKITLQLEKDLDGKTIFYEPCYSIHGTNLMEIIKEVNECEEQYKNDMEEFNKKYPYEQWNEAIKPIKKIAMHKTRSKISDGEARSIIYLFSKITKIPTSILFDLLYRECHEN
jgi:hypothetical protein